jgi:hypothetical protein
MQLRFPPFEFDRIGCFAIRPGVKLDEIRDTGEIKSLTDQRQRGDTADSLDPALAWLMDGIVQNPPFRREAIFFPQTFDVNQRGLTQAIDRVLKGRERDRIVYMKWIHGSLHSEHVRDLDSFR